MRVRCLSVENAHYKMGGAEWISLRMVHGSRPIILKAPKLFRNRVIHIEPVGEGAANTFALRIVDPIGEDRSEPRIISREAAQEAMGIFTNAEGHEETDTRG